MKIVKRIFSLSVFALGLCSIAGLLSPLNWFFDLFNHFRPQAAIAGILFLIPIALLRDKQLLVLTAAIVLLNLSLMGFRVYLFQKNALADKQAHSPKTISLIAANVNTSNSDYEAVIRMAEREQPDIFIATEVNTKWVKQLEYIEKFYPHRFKLPYDDNFGVAIYSKIPFKAQSLKVGHDYALPLIFADFDDFVLLATHPIPPIGKEDAPETTLYLTEVAKRAQNIERPVIVAGDMNTTMWSDNIKPYIGAGLASANPSGIAWTWPAGFFPLAIEIDHVFVRNASAQNFKVLEDIGSDHYPVEAVISLPVKGVSEAPK